MAKSTAKRGKAKSKRGSGKRQLINTGTDKRFVRRSAKGRFKDDVGKSLSADRRRKATTKARAGQGDRGDR
jgi:hypothetical protein